MRRASGIIMHIDSLPGKYGIGTFGKEAFEFDVYKRQGPDIMFGLAHDNLGTFQKAGLLAEVPEGIINDSRCV